MKKLFLNLSILVLAVMSGVFVTYGVLLIFSAIKEGHDIGVGLAVLIASIYTALTLFLVAVFLSTKSRQTSVVTAAVFLPFVIITVIITLWFVMHRPLEKEFRLNLDPNPLLYGGERVEKLVMASFLEKPYWMNAEEAQAYLTSLYNRKEKNARLIKFSDPKSIRDVIGIEERIVLEAFGQPIRQDTEGGHDVWTYFPWEDHPDWQMKVFLKDGRLQGIGELPRP